MGKRTVSIVLEDERVWEGFCRLVEAKYGRKWKFLGRGALVARLNSQQGVL